MESTSSVPELQRLSTHIPGLDDVLGGGLMVGDAYLIAGKPGTGKTTLGNQLAFAHAAAGGTVLFATLLTESHDRMLAHLHGFRFADHALVGARIHYLSLLGALQDGDIDGALHTLMTMLRTQRATLLIIDGAGAARMFANSKVDYLQFLHALQARTALLGCTLILLSSRQEEANIATHVDGVITLVNKPTPLGDVRTLRVSKLRGSFYLQGHHSFTIGHDGIAVFPRLEAASATLEPTWHESQTRLTFGIPGLDAMTGGGLAAGSTTLLFGTPGSGKTLLGLSFLAEGARRGERGLHAGFEETPAALTSTAKGAGMELAPHLASGLLLTMWRPALVLTPDEWAWQLLTIVDEHKPRRLVIDGFNNLLPFFANRERVSRYATALTNNLRDRSVTTVFTLEVDTFVGPEVAIPVPNVSAAMDNGILVRTVELGSTTRRLVSILKQRETDFDPTIREFTIGPQGIEFGDAFDGHALLTGSAVPSAEE